MLAMNEERMSQYQQESSLKSTLPYGPMTVREWLDRTDLPSRSYHPVRARWQNGSSGKTFRHLLGHWLSTTSRVLITGPTGLGKTMKGIALGFAIADGRPFLHWEGRRPTRVLYIDGEMARNVTRDRLADEARRCGCIPPTFFLLSKEDREDMPPINDQDKSGRVIGTKWFDKIIDAYKPELIIFDNIQSLLIGDMTKEEGWSLVLPWMRTLTKRNIAQIWFHHTGHDESKSYGSKTKEWGLDTHILMKRNAIGEQNKDILSFDITFKKKRMSTPSTYKEFDDATVLLKGGKWSTLSKGIPSDQKVLEALEAFPNGAAFGELERASGLKSTTFKDAHRRLKGREQIVKGADGKWLLVRRADRTADAA